MLDTPVALIVFNRPRTTARIVEAIRAARPSRLFVIADGPRPGHATDAEQCAAARATVDQVDWPGEVCRHYAEGNLGIDRRGRSGFDWLFAQVDRAIILEDDCLPDLTFFPFCGQLLERYALDERVAMICGTNSLGRWGAGTQSYHFSSHGCHWGWATWRRAWRLFGPRMNEVESDVWDVKWSAVQRLEERLAIVPAVNLVSNIGFGPQGAHTRVFTLGSNLVRYEMPFPLRHPTTVAADTEFDRECLAWRAGKPGSESLIARVEEQIEAKRFALALLLAEAGLQNGIAATEEACAGLEKLKGQARNALGARR